MEKFAIALIEKPHGEGLTRTEVCDLYDMLGGVEAFPFGVQAQCSAAMGFISTESAEAMGYDYGRAEAYIRSILEDMEKENDTCEYTFAKDFLIWISREEPGKPEHVAEPVTLEADAVICPTLLSVDEYLEARRYVPDVDGDWWLRSSGFYVNCAVSVRGNDGIVFDDGIYTDQVLGVRPALRLIPGTRTRNLPIGSKVRAAGHLWTVIPGNMALCDEFVGKAAFREDWQAALKEGRQAEKPNDYWASDIKKWLERWARDRGLPAYP